MMYELIIVLGLIAAFFAGQQAQAIGVSLGLLDDPKAEAHKAHVSAVPQAGLVFSFLYTASASLAAILKPEASYIIVVVQLLTLTAVVAVTSSKPKAVPSNPAE